MDVWRWPTLSSCGGLRIGRKKCSSPPLKNHGAPTWRRTALDRQGCQVVHTRDVTARAAADCSVLLSMSTRWPEGTVTDAERQGWERAFAAFDRGIVGSFRVVAARR